MRPTLSHVTDDVLDRSERHREIMGPGGFGDELRAVLVDGQTWGGLALLRGADRAPFSPADAALVAAVTQRLAEGLRRAVLLDHAASGRRTARTPRASSCWAPNGSITFADEVAAAWIDALGGGSVPPVVTAVASRARTVVARPAHDGRIAWARVRAPSGRWLVVRASVLADEPGAQVAVMIEPARPHELAPLVADAYGLTDREREVTQLVAWRAAHRCHRGAPAPVVVDGAGSPQGDLREARRRHARRARRAPVLPAERAAALSPPRHAR